MDLRKLMTRFGHEQVLVCQDTTRGLFAIIAIHDTTLGPALGGCRMWPYRDEEEAMVDALRLSRGMTYKAALAGMHLGGGKAVIIGDPKSEKTPELFQAFGRFVESLGGRYITAEDVGTSVLDMQNVMKETTHVVGGPTHEGSSGDPSPFTALGVFQGIRASLYYARKSTSLKGISVAVQGVGNVGGPLLEHLVKGGAKVFVADVDKDRVQGVLAQYPKLEVVGVDEIITLDVDILCPCALGAVINDENVEKVKAKIVAGSANNQLHETRHGEILSKRGVLYAPDYCINVGGLVNVYFELVGYHRKRAIGMIEGIYDSLLHVYQTAEERSISTCRAADLLASLRIRRVAKAKRQAV